MTRCNDSLTFHPNVPSFTPLSLPPNPPMLSIPLLTFLRHISLSQANWTVLLSVWFGHLLHFLSLYCRMNLTNCDIAKGRHNPECAHNVPYQNETLKNMNSCQYIWLNVDAKTEGKVKHCLILCLVTQILNWARKNIFACLWFCHVAVLEYPLTNAIELLPKITLMASNLCRNHFKWEDLTELHLLHDPINAVHTWRCFKCQADRLEWLIVNLDGKAKPNWTNHQVSMKLSIQVLRLLLLWFTTEGVLLSIIFHPWGEFFNDVRWVTPFWVPSLTHDAQGPTNITWAGSRWGGERAWNLKVTRTHHLVLLLEFVCIRIDQKRGVLLR